MKHWILRWNSKRFSRGGVLGTLKRNIGVHDFSSAKTTHFKRHFRILSGCKEETRSCWLCALLLQAAGLTWPSAWGCGICHWGGNTGLCGPFIAGWCPCAEGLCFISFWFHSLSWLGITWDFTHILNYQFSFSFSFSFMILTWKKIISKKQARAELDDSFSLLGMVVKISHNIWLVWTDFDIFYSFEKKMHFYDYMYIFSLTVNV